MANLWKPIQTRLLIRENSSISCCRANVLAVGTEGLQPTHVAFIGYKWRHDRAGANEGLGLCFVMLALTLQGDTSTAPRGYEANKPPPQSWPVSCRPEPAPKSATMWCLVSQANASRSAASSVVIQVRVANKATGQQCLDLVRKPLQLFGFDWVHWQVVRSSYCLSLKF